MGLKGLSKYGFPEIGYLSHMALLIINQRISGGTNYFRQHQFKKKKRKTNFSTQFEEK